MKYRLKPKCQQYKNIEYRRLCISCGKEETLFIPEFMPRPNTSYIGTPSPLKCKLFGNHQFYYEDELEPTK